MIPDLKKLSFEMQIEEKVKEVDAIRGNLAISADRKKHLIEEVESEIQDLKRESGPRRITGTIGLGN